MGNKAQGIKLGGGMGYSLESTGSYSLVSSGYSLGKAGYSLASPGYSAIGSRGYGSFSFNNSRARTYGLYAVKKPLFYLGMTDMVKEELKRYKKKLYNFDLESRLENHNYRFN